MSAQEDPRLDECTAQEKAKALKTLRQFDQGEMSLSELEAQSPVLSKLCAEHAQELLDEPPRWINSPIDYVVLESEIHGSPLDAKALNDYLALIQTALKMDADASKLKIQKVARRGIAIEVARLDRDDAFMKRLIGGLWEKYPDEARGVELPKVGQGGSGNVLTPPGSPLDDLKDPIKCVWVVERVGKTARRSDSLARSMRAKNYPIVKCANTNYCQRKDAIAMFSRFKHRLIEQTHADA
ncbi:MAG: hypothetical protein O7D91_09325 [Planctomycetota bacterium]|nr:hypothetical protein [Planctomycetota bacterium]